jgi:hypothetical protein
MKGIFVRLARRVCLLWTVLLVETFGGQGAEFAHASAESIDAKVNLCRAASAVSKFQPDLSIRCESNAGRYPWKLDIVSTVFWVGEIGGGPTNARSAWDANWEANFGGIDDPHNRRGYEPLAFVPRESPFYVALPYCDMQDGKLKPEASKLVPWFIQKFRNQKQSVCKGRWLAIRHGMKICYGQWEDVGPFHTDEAQYVFGDERPSPNSNQGAGIDVSPAVRDYLGLGPLDIVDWIFVEEGEVPLGPWSNCSRMKSVIALNR